MSASGVSPARPSLQSREFHSESSAQARLYFGSAAAAAPTSPTRAETQAREQDRANRERRLQRDLQAATQERFYGHGQQLALQQEHKDNHHASRRTASYGASLADFDPSSLSVSGGGGGGGGALRDASPLRRARCVVAGCSFEPVGGGGRGFCAVHSQPTAGTDQPVRVIVRQRPAGSGERSHSPAKSLPVMHFLTGTLAPSPVQAAVAAASIGLGTAPNANAGANLTLPALPPQSPASHTRTQIMHQQSGSNVPVTGGDDAMSQFLASASAAQPSTGLSSPYKLSSSRAPGPLVQYAGEEAPQGRMITPSAKGPRTMQHQPSPPNSAAQNATPSRALRTPAGLALSYEHGRNIKGLRKEVLYKPSSSSSADSASTTSTLQPIHSLSLAGALSRVSSPTPHAPTSARSSATGGLLAPLAGQFAAAAKSPADSPPTTSATAAAIAPTPPPAQAVVISSVSLSSSQAEKPMSAVQRQRAYRAALLSKALSKPSSVQSLDRQRLDTLRDLLTKRQDLEHLMRRKIVLGEADAKERSALKEASRSSLAHLLQLRPSATTLANKNILKGGAIDGARGDERDRTAVRDTLGAFFAHRPSILDVQAKFQPPAKTLLSQLGPLLGEEAGDEPSDEEGEVPEEPSIVVATSTITEEGDHDDGGKDEESKEEASDAVTAIERTFRKFPTLRNAGPSARRPSLAPGGRKFSVFTSSSLADKLAAANSTAPGTTVVTTMDKLSSFLERRPHYETLMKHNVLKSVPGTAFHSNPALAANARKMSFSNLRSSVSKLLLQRPTMSDLKHMAKDLLGKMVSGQMAHARDVELDEEQRAELVLKASDVEAGLIEDHVAPPPGISLESLASGNLKIDEILAHKRRITEQKLRLRAREEDAPGGLYMRGSNERGQVGGHPGHVVEFVATLSYLRPLVRETVVQVACGFEHTLIRTIQDAVFVTGKNSYGQLGLGDTLDRDQPYSLSYRGSILQGKACSWIAAYERTSAVLTAEGDVYTMGDLLSGSLGHGDPDAPGFGEDGPAAITLPTPIPELHLKSVRRMDLGAHHGAAVTKAGRMFTWGRNSCGQLGNGDFIDQLKPALIKGFGEFWAEVSCGGEHTAAIGFDGNIHLWGSNRNGQLGFQTTPAWNSPQTVPRACMSLFRKGVHKLSCGRHHTVALTEDGDAFSTQIIDNPRLVDKCKFHRLHPTLHLKDAVATPVDSTIAIDLEGMVYTYEPNSFDDPKVDDTLESRHLHQLAAGLEHIAIVGTLNKAWRAQAQELHEKTVSAAAAAAKK